MLKKYGFYIYFIILHLIVLNRIRIKLCVDGNHLYTGIYAYSL